MIILAYPFYCSILKVERKHSFWNNYILLKKTCIIISLPLITGTFQPILYLYYPHEIIRRIKQGDACLTFGLGIDAFYTKKFTGCYNFLQKPREEYTVGAHRAIQKSL